MSLKKFKSKESRQTAIAIQIKEAKLSENEKDELLRDYIYRWEITVPIVCFLLFITGVMIGVYLDDISTGNQERDVIGSISDYICSMTNMSYSGIDYFYEEKGYTIQCETELIFIPKDVR